MRRWSILLYVSLSLLLLGGCDASLAADRHDAERLLLIQTMGLDREDGHLVMSVSSGLGPDEKPSLVMSAAASGIEDAIARLQNYSPENQLFYAHVQYLLLGEQFAGSDLDQVIEWVDRSPTLRMDTNMLIVRGTARDAVVDSSEQATDITQRLASLDRQAQASGWSVRTLREVAAALAEGDGALCLTVRTAPSDGNVFTEDQRADAVVPAGYAILNGDGLAAFLSPEASLGAELLTGDPTGLLITVEGCTLELLGGSAEIDGRFAGDGAVEGLDIRCTLQAGLLEKAEDRSISPEKLNEALSGTVGEWVYEALDAAQQLGCDYLGLRRAALKSAPDKAAAGRAWGEAFPAIPISVTVDGIVERSYDLAE